MEYLTLISSVALIHFLSLMMPGPDFIMAIKNSLTYSRKTGILTGIGISLGMATHIFYCMAGLAILISQSTLIFNVIKLLGAGYLIFIGLKTIFSKSSDIEVNEKKQKNDISSFEAIKSGFLTNVLNPRATLFFLSLFTVVISPETPNIVLGILAVIMVLNTILWFSLVAIFLNLEKIRIAFGKFQRVLNKILGSFLVGLGIKIALSQK